MQSLLFSVLALLLLSSCRESKTYQDGKPFSHKLWDDLLSKHVKSNGLVDYEGFRQDSATFNAYLSLFKHTHPDKYKWTKNEQLAYWINAYNAFTVKLIVDNLPLESIKDLNPLLSTPMFNTIWDKKFIPIEEEMYSLNNIEHDILRKQFDEPRIHFAINCASFSCPDLRAQAYNPERIDSQLEEQSILFINDPNKNSISSEEVELSKIFQWYQSDFTKNGTLIEFINLYSDIKVKSDSKIEYLDYNWSLNGG